MQTRARSALTVMIYAVPDGIPPKAFGPITKDLRRRLSRALEWSADAIAVLPLSEWELRELDEELERNARGGSLRILRKLRRRGRSFLERERDHRFVWIRYVDPILGVYYLLAVCRAEESEWALRMAAEEPPPFAMGPRAVPN
jgi:hypothetical protein